MYHKNSGDYLAESFQKLMNSKIQKKAEMEGAEAPSVDQVSMADDADLESAAKDMLRKEEGDQSDYSKDVLSEEMNMLDDMAYDETSKEAAIMRGLGKLRHHCDQRVKTSRRMLLRLQLDQFMATS